MMFRIMIVHKFDNNFQQITEREENSFEKYTIFDIG